MANRQDIYRPNSSQLDSHRQKYINACQYSTNQSNEASKSNDSMYINKINLPDHASEINIAQDADKLPAAESKSPNSTNDSKSQMHEVDKPSNELVHFHNFRI